MILLVILVILAYMALSHIIDYRILKNYYLQKQRWDLNICCGNTDGGGVNADIVYRNVPNFVLTGIYNLPFKDKVFKNVLCSHTIEHVEDPENFYEELRRVSENVTFLIPPLWDLMGILLFTEHKWLFLTFKSKHVNTLPKKIKLPYWWYHRKFGQRIK